MEKKDVISKFSEKILSLNNVIGIGWGLKEVAGKRTADEAIHILVQKKLPREQLRQRDIAPEMIEGIPTDVIEIGQVKALATLRTKKDRPAHPGVSIGHYLISAGTFGAVVYDAKTGHPLILSNNHVLANTSTVQNRRAKVGDPILQPGPYDGGTIDSDVIAFLDRYHPLILKNSRSKTTNVVDCAVAFPVDNQFISKKILGLGHVAGVRVPELGEILYKSGRTTGVTQGPVRTLGATLTVQMGNGEEAVFTNQVIVGMVSDGGDSGALVVDSRQRACGLLFAGSTVVTICNPIEAVLQALQVTFDPKLKK